MVGFGPEESFLAKSRRILSGHAAPVSAAAVRKPESGPRIGPRPRSGHVDSMEILGLGKRQRFLNVATGLQSSLTGAVTRP